MTLNTRATRARARAAAPAVKRQRPTAGPKKRRRLHKLSRRAEEFLELEAVQDDNAESTATNETDDSDGGDDVPPLVSDEEEESDAEDEVPLGPLDGSQHPDDNAPALAVDVPRREPATADVRQREPTASDESGFTKLYELASTLTPELRAKLANLLGMKAVDSTVPSMPIDLDEPYEHTPGLPDGAVPLSDFVEIPTSAKGFLCGIHALNEYLERLMPTYKPKPPEIIRNELFGYLEDRVDIPFVGDLTYRTWAKIHDKTVEQMLASDKAGQGLSNFLMAVLADMYRLAHRLYSVCMNDATFIYPTQNVQSKLAIGKWNILFRGGGGNTMGHFSLLLNVVEDAALLRAKPTEHADELFTVNMTPRPSPATPAKAATPRAVLHPCKPPTQVNTASIIVAPTPCASAVHTPDSKSTTLIATKDATKVTTPTSTPLPMHKFRMVEYDNFTLSVEASHYVNSKLTPDPIDLVLPEIPEYSNANKVTIRMYHADATTGKTKSSFGFLGQFQQSAGRLASSMMVTEPLTKNNFFNKGRIMLLLAPRLGSEVFLAKLDDLLARFLYHLDLDRVRQPKLFTIIEGVKARSDGTIGNFASLLWELDGASRLTDERVLKLQHNTIGKVNPGAVRLTPMQRSQNLGAAYAELSGREFSMPHGQSLHPNGTLTELTMDNTATYSAIPGLDDGRKVFVVVAFEGVFSITSENKVFLRVQPVLLRYVLLDVDGTLPRRLSTPTRDPYCSNPPDDFDD